MNVYLNYTIRYCRTAPFIQSSTKITFIFQQTNKKQQCQQNKTTTTTLPPPTVRIIQKFNKKIIETVTNSKHVSHNAHIYELSLSCYSTGFLINTGGVELVLWSPISPFLQWCGHATVFHMWVQSQPSLITGCTG